MPKILVVEDEAAIARVLVDNLLFEGHEAEAVADGAEGLERALAWQPDLILLDIVLPTMDGYEVCRRLRTQGAATPIIMLTARGEEVDKVLGLELGADDYVTKPVGVRELMARIKAVLRRGRRHQPRARCWSSDKRESTSTATRRPRMPSRASVPQGLWRPAPPMGKQGPRPDPDADSRAGVGLRSVPHHAHGR